MFEKKMSPKEFLAKLAKDDRKALKNLNEKRKTDFISSGSWVIDKLIGDGSGTFKSGGLPRGHVVEAYGNESCGKTTLGINGCIQAQQLGELAVWLDYERTFQPDYAQRLGLNLDADKFMFFEPDHFEHGIRLIDQVLPCKPAIIVVDSVSAMIPRQFLEGEVDEMGRIGLQAQLLSMSINYLTKFIAHSNTCLFFINQLRSVIKTSKYDPGPTEETSGGKALKYYSSIRIKMQTSTIEKVDRKSFITGKKEKEPVNVMVKVTMTKNKIDKPYFSGPIYIRFGEGFDNINSIIELAINSNIIKKSGAFFRFEVGGKSLIDAQGREQLRTLLEQDQKILEALTNCIKLKVDEQAVEEEAEEPVEDVVEPGTPGSGTLNTILEKAADTFVKTRKAKNAKSED